MALWHFHCVFLFMLLWFLMIHSNVPVIIIHYFYNNFFSLWICFNHIAAWMGQEEYDFATFPDFTFRISTAANWKLLLHRCIIWRYVSFATIFNGQIQRVYTFFIDKESWEDELSFWKLYYQEVYFILLCICILLKGTVIDRLVPDQRQPCPDQ